MKYCPHEYQKYAVEYIESHPVCAVFLDMGLGKTSITLTAVNDLIYDSFEVRKVLVIAPLRVARFTWPAEIRKWDHLKHLRYSAAVGTESERKSALRKDADIYIINRDNVQWLIEESGLPFDYDMVVIDELSSFKNNRAKRFRALMKVRPKIHRIVGLTGTPAGNGLMDLWAQFRLLDMGERLGRFITRYREAYFTPDRRNGMVVYSYKPLPFAENMIYEKISDITISMKAADHLKMPDLISAEYKVELDETEMKKYRGFLKNMAEGGITAANAGALTNKLSQMANGAVYDDEGETIHIHDRKLDALEDIVEAANGKPLLVAYWFKHDYAGIAYRLDKIKCKCRKLDSEESINAWNAGEVEVGLIHPASAGHGLNLQEGGNTIVWFGLTWSLELYQQTNARLWRQGQSEKTVVVQHIIAEDTVDERILKALKSKNTTQEALIEAVKAEVKKYDC